MFFSLEGLFDLFFLVFLWRIFVTSFFGLKGLFTQFFGFSLWRVC